jgi:hypothetical protein
MLRKTPLRLATFRGRRGESGAGRRKATSEGWHVGKYDEQVARALAGAHNTARVAHQTPEYVRVAAGLGSAFVWALLDLADAIRSTGSPPPPPSRDVQRMS